MKRRFTELLGLVRYGDPGFRRVGVRELLRHRRVRPATLVMHQFMEAAEVGPAWKLTQHGLTSDSSEVRAPAREAS